MIRSVCSAKWVTQRKVLPAWYGFAVKISFRFIISFNFTIATDLPYFLWLNEETREAAFSDSLLISDLIFSNRLFISSSLDIFDFIIVTRRLMEE